MTTRSKKKQTTNNILLDEYMSTSRNPRKVYSTCSPTSVRGRMALRSRSEPGGKKVISRQDNILEEQSDAIQQKSRKGKSLT